MQSDGVSLKMNQQDYWLSTQTACFLPIAGSTLYKHLNHTDHQNIPPHANYSLYDNSHTCISKVWASNHILPSIGLRQGFLDLPRLEPMANGIAGAYKQSRNPKPMLACTAHYNHFGHSGSTSTHPRTATVELTILAPSTPT